MKPRSSLAVYSFACALVVLSACTKALTIDEGEGQAGASAGQGVTGGSGEAGQGETGGSGEAGQGETGGSGEAGQGVTGGSGDNEPISTTPWPGNDSSCPDQPAMWEEPCELEEGVTCAYYYQQANNPQSTSYNECTCRAFCGGEQKWDCYRQITGPYMECPANEPEQDSGCFGSKGLECYYPTNVTCECPTEGDEPTWDCGIEGTPAGEHPTVVEESKLVGELSAEERAAWCAWYAPVEPGFPQPQVFPADEDGFYPDTGCNTSGTLGCNVARPNDLPAGACEANLALSTCEATVFDLNDCVLSMKTGTPSPNGCARYIEAPGCSGTLVNQLSGEPTAAIGLPGDNSCRVRVE
jgi:hypothetical protein